MTTPAADRATTLQHAIDVHCRPEAFYDYVTQPWCWHEWHPSSRSARAAVAVLGAGDEFDEIVELQPFAPLPPRLTRSTHYRVEVAERARHWRVRGAMRDGWLEIDYRFEAAGGGTRFTRTLRYDARGPSRLLLPFLRRRNAALSLLALQQLKARLEHGDAG